MSREHLGHEIGLWLQLLPVFWRGAPGFSLCPFLLRGNSSDLFGSLCFEGQGTRNYSASSLGCVLAQGFLLFLLAPSPDMAWVCLLGRPRPLPSFCSLCLPLTPPGPVVSGRWNSRCADRPLGCQFLSSAALPQPELTSGAQDAVVTGLQFTGAHYAPGPPAAEEAMGSLAHGEILVWMWMGLMGTSSPRSCLRTTRTAVLGCCRSCLIGTSVNVSCARRTCVLSFLRLYGEELSLWCFGAF